MEKSRKFIDAVKRLAYIVVMKANEIQNLMNELAARYAAARKEISKRCDTLAGQSLVISEAEAICGHSVSERDAISILANRMAHA